MTKCYYCGLYYYGFHTCNVITSPTYPNYTYTYPPQQLEAKPKYGPHKLDCGCEVETKVVKHCDTLHKAPEE